MTGLESRSPSNIPAWRRSSYRASDFLGKKMMCWIDVILAVPCSKVGVTVVLAARVTLHFPKPVHAPDHPANVVPSSGVAVNTTAVPLGKLAVQLCLQLIPAGELLTVPLPVPALFNVIWIDDEFVVTAPLAWLLTPTPANAGTAHGRSIERT